MTSLSAPLPAARRDRRLSGFITGALAALAMFFQAGTASAVSLIRDTEIEILLRDYGDPLFAVAGLDPKAVTIYIINDPSINAFVTNGQSMYIHTGLFMELEDPNQVIGIMAHETGHIAGGHISRTGSAMEEAAVPVLITLLAGVAAVALGAPDAGMGLILGSQQIAQRTFLQYSRTQESAADQAGVTYLEATGQSGHGMLEVFERFSDQEILSFRRQDPYVRSHPLSRDRINALRDRVTASAHFERATTQEEQMRYDLVRAKIRGFVDRPDVTLRNYPLTDQSAPARYARAVAWFREPQFERALIEINSLIAEFPDNPFFQELKGQIAMERGDAAMAIAAYGESVRLLPDAPLLQVNLGSALIAAENPAYDARARQILETALRDDNSNAFAWFQLALVYARQGDQGMADLASAERDYAIGNLPGALQFAMRARQRLKRGTGAWQRNEDIINVVTNAMRDGGGGG
ncbi:MAG TPA: M48 family metalloprotease [Micropepsaceae bacterium]|nr:M48 family metalloprotease [Micropepsaceae bacterium]